MQSAEAFERGLKNYDAALSLRWGNTIKQWVIERKGRRILPSHLTLLKHASSQDRPDPKAVEEYESARDGKYVVFYATHLDNRIHDWLWANDTRRVPADVFVQKELARKFLPRQERENRLRELDREVPKVMHWMTTKHAGEIDHEGKADELMREAFGKSNETRNPQVTVVDPTKPKPGKGGVTLT